MFQGMEGVSAGGVLHGDHGLDGAQEEKGREIDWGRTNEFTRNGKKRGTVGGLMGAQFVFNGGVIECFRQVLLEVCDSGSWWRMTREKIETRAKQACNC